MSASDDLMIADVRGARVKVKSTPDGNLSHVFHVNIDEAVYPITGLDFTNGQRVAIGGSSTQSSAITATQIAIRPTAACYIAVGSNPTASASSGSSFPVPADELLYLKITSGDKIAVVQNSGAGYLYVMPVT